MKKFSEVEDVDIRFEEKLAIAIVNEKCNDKELATKFKKALEDLGYTTKIETADILYVPGLSDNNDKAIIEKVLSNSAKAVVSIYQEKIEYRKVYVYKPNNKLQDIESKLKELGFKISSSKPTIEKINQVQFECTSTEKTSTFEIQSNAIESSVLSRGGDKKDVSILKFTVTTKTAGKKEILSSTKPTENQDIEKDSTFYVKVSLTDTAEGEHSEGTYNLSIKKLIAPTGVSDKELAKCTVEE